jgi:alpha-galactosidase
MTVARSPRSVCGAVLKVMVALAIACMSLFWPGRTGPVQAVNLGGWGLAATPPMGWNDWYSFGCNVNETIIRQTADALVASGMAAAGYRYVNIDDCWQTGRDSSGTIVADPTSFPSGIKALADYVHARGLKLGIYTDAGTMTCAGRPGSLGHEYRDVKTYASWGVDFVKVDWCHTDGMNAKAQYGLWRDAIAAAGRPMVFSICNWGVESPWTWGPGTAHMWRTTGDRQDTWSDFLAILDKNAALATHAGPFAWNDPDILQVGRGGMTDREYRSEFSLWAMMAAPLLAGNDLRVMSPATRETLMNREIIAVNQDRLGVQAKVVRQDAQDDTQVWSKPLQPLPTDPRGAVVRAVALFNRSDARKDVTVNWADLGVAPGSVVRVRDLWAHRDLAPAEWSRAGVGVSVPEHGIVVVRVVGRAR